VRKHEVVTFCSVTMLLPLRPHPLSADRRQPAFLSTMEHTTAMTAPTLAPAYDGLATYDDFTRTSCWDPIAECTMIMARPAAEPGLFARYHRGAVASYARFGVSDALDPTSTAALRTRRCSGC
jgi:hypothetical protein